MAHYILIDGNNMAFQSQTAAMDAKSRSKRLFCGEQETTAINGVLHALRSTQVKFSDGKPLMLWDTGKAWRYGIYPDYKGNRKDNPIMLEAKAALATQFPYMEPIFDAMGVPQVTCENYEADDIAAFMADLLSNKGHKVTLVSRDQDWLQMVRPNVRWYDRFADRMVTRVSFEADVGFPSPEEFSESKIFKGDAGDNVVGIKGVGPVAAEHLVREFKTPEGFIDGWRDWVSMGGLADKHPLNRHVKAIETFLADPTTAKKHMALNRKLMDLRIMYGDRTLLGSLKKSSGAVNRAYLREELPKLAFVNIVTDLDGWLAPFCNTTNGVRHT